ncbi:MAG: PDZ domain-containing protein [Gemmatimonadetes bacterium]|nr:PDZ domain-containing protein [Gemmatimonadota bacterium]
MIRPLRPWILFLTLAVPFGAYGQRGTGGDAKAPVVEVSPEARVLFGTIDALRNNALEVRGDSAFFEMAIDGLIKGLSDPYATVLTPDEVREFEEQSTGNYAGIGIAISRLSGSVTITKVFRGTPAERSGLQVGDRIVRVGSEDGHDWTEDDASSRIRGQAGTTVIVGVERDGFSGELSHEMGRAEVHIPAVSAETLFSDIGYISVERVTRNSAAEVDSVLTTLANTRGLILDLRRNPGGYLDEALRMSDLFLDRGAVLARTRSRVRGGTEVLEEAHYDRLTPRVPELPIVVLVDQFSASAAEIVAGALQDHDRALIIGERTFGKGTVQSVIPLPEGRLLRVTSGEWLTPQGRSLKRQRDADGNVIEPDSDSIPEYRSMGGRVLLGGGGVFPDLEVRVDTLSTREQAIPLAAVEAEIFLARRIQEAAFEAGRGFRESGDVPAGFPEASFTNFVQSLVDAGIAEEAMNEDSLDYLRWQLEREMYNRMEDEGRYLEVQSERDTVLATAIRLLTGATRQEDLFTLADAEHAAMSSIPARTPGL